MKTKIISGLTFLVLVLLTACNTETPKDETAPSVSTDVINVPATASGTPAEPGSAPVMSFSEERHDFGKITQGEKLSYSFMFKNTGGSDLVISSAQGSCGCTVPTYPRVPVKAGETSKIDVVFDSEGKSGLVQKTVTLVTNCNPSTRILTISSTIVVPEEE
ncbi:MAG: hypothetical protein JWO09_800 [Bacteroidetes bacterium]|nr:hypothetical protein [Bacteroidota bacterium]